MKLKDLLNGIDYSLFGDSEIEIKGIEHNSKKISKDYLFFCIEGKNVNGFDYCFEVNRIIQGREFSFYWINTEINLVIGILQDWFN